MIAIRILIILLFFSCRPENSQTIPTSPETAQSSDQRIKLRLSGRVDTTNTEIKNVLALYENYLNSKPDSIYNNPFWNQKEKKQYKDFDFSRVSMFNGFNSSQLFRIYTPFVLSVEPLKDKYQIRVLYSNTATQEPYVGSKVWCIHKLSAIQEGENWKLENLIAEETKDWKKRSLSFIEYIYPNDHTFNNEKANKAKMFCESIINRFNPTYNSRFKFYIASNVDNMGVLENFDYYFTGITTGKAREGMILTSKNNEFYPHEFIHKLLPENKQRGHVIEEGLATFLGTKEDIHEYIPQMKKLAFDFFNNESYTLKNILNNQVEWNGYPVAYPAGALICEVIHLKKGDEGINQLINGNTMNSESIIKLTMEILNINEEELIRLINSKMSEYK